MISKLSKYMLEYLISSNVIENTDENKEIYKYGTEITISSFINVLSIMLMGFLSNSYFECIVFIVLLVLLRMYTGGYHADTYLKCNLILCLNYLTVIILYRLMPLNKLVYFIAICLACLMIIILFCPVENENKKLSLSKKRKFRRLSVILGTLYGAAAVVLYVFKYKIGILILGTLFSVSMAVIAEKIKERGCKHGK